MRLCEYMVPMDDGVRLYTLVLLPDAEGKYATVFFRCPYDPKPSPEWREGMKNMVGAYVQNGFAVVWQQCRGCGGSEGEFVPFVGERADGLAAIRWIENADWFDGRVYLSGGSYLCYVHLSYLAVAPACVKGACLAIMSARADKALYQNGVFKADLGPMWYMSVYHKDKLLYANPREAYDAQWDVLPRADFMKRVYGEDAPHFNDFAKYRFDPLAVPGGFSEAYDAFRKCPVPVLLRDGWADVFFNGMADAWDELPEGIRAKSAFLMGPWGHDQNVNAEWRYAFPDGNAPADTDVNWLAHLRDGAPLTFLKEGRVTYYEPGAGAWRDEARFPDGDCEKAYYLAPDSRLTDAEPEPGWAEITADPDDPARFPGGPNAFCTRPNAFAAQPEMNFRPDVRSFATDAFDQPIRLAGEMEALLDLCSDCDDTMFVLRLCVAEKDGTATIIQEAPFTLAPYEANAMRVSRATFPRLCWTIRAGERLRLDVSCANASNYPAHTNTCDDFLTATGKRVAHNRILLGRSKLILRTRGGEGHE